MRLWKNTRGFWIRATVYVIIGAWGLWQSTQLDAFRVRFVEVRRGGPSLFFYSGNFMRVPFGGMRLLWWQLKLLSATGVNLKLISTAMVPTFSTSSDVVVLVGVAGEKDYEKVQIVAKSPESERYFKFKEGHGLADTMQTGLLVWSISTNDLKSCSTLEIVDLEKNEILHRIRLPSIGIGPNKKESDPRLGNTNTNALSR